jgi:diaminopimelate epimerase
MRIPFYKYHGTGNDFIIIDNRKLFFISSQELISNLCDRHFGIGADGLLLLQERKSYDFEMVYYNSDGKEATMCGNGGRCITAFAYKLGICNERVRFIAADGKHIANIIDHDNEIDRISLKMSDVKEVEASEDVFIMNTGTPHYVMFVSDVKKMDVVSNGRDIRYGQRFAEKGINVDFAEIHDNNLMVRTYEKGIEDETLSCGTGVTASAIAASYKNNHSRYSVQTKGGSLMVSFKKSIDFFNDIWLEGPTKLVFNGEIEI